MCFLQSFLAGGSVAIQTWSIYKSLYLKRRGQLLSESERVITRLYFTLLYYVHVRDHLTVTSLEVVNHVAMAQKALVLNELHVFCSHSHQWNQNYLNLVENYLKPS